MARDLLEHRPMVNRLALGFGAAVFAASMGWSIFAHADQPGCIVTDPGPLDDFQRHHLADSVCSALVNRHAPPARYRISVVETQTGVDVRLQSEAGSARLESKTVDDVFVQVPLLAQSFVDKLAPPTSHDEPARQVEACDTGHIKFNPDDDSQLFKIPKGETDSTLICRGPCNIDVSMCDSFQIGGPDRKPSPQFKLDSNSVEVKGRGSSGLRIGGIVLVAVGAGLSLVGFVEVGQNRTQDLGIGLLVGSGAMIGAGAIMAVVGRSRIEQSPVATRTPTWRTADVFAVERKPAPFNLTFQF